MTTRVNIPPSDSKIHIWYQAIRPRSLTATYIPVALGGVIAFENDKFHISRFILALLGVLFLQISANLLNEYFDYVKGSDTQKTHGLGMILARGLLTPKQVLVGGIFVLVLGVVIGLYFVAITGPLVLAIGIGGTLAVILYTAGPYPLAYIGLGELTVFIFMGPLIVLGTDFVLSEVVHSAAIWGSLPIAFLVANILHANNLRDLDADAAEHKRTLAVIFGRRFARFEYVTLTSSAFISTILLVLTGVVPILTLAVGIFAWEGWKLMQIATHSVDPAELHMVLLRTARLHKWFGGVYVGAWLLAVLI